MSSHRELWYTTGSSSGRLPENSPMRAALSTLPTSSQPTEFQRIARGIRATVSEFGSLNDAAMGAAATFEDTKMALDALVAAHGKGVLEEPGACVFCDLSGDRVQHWFDTAYLAGVPIWTRVCASHLDEPLCPKTPDGFHDEFIAASHEGFQIEHTTVVDPDRLDDIGHCGLCATPLIKDPAFKVRYEDEGWRYWTAQERGKLL